MRPAPTAKRIIDCLPTVLLREAAVLISASFAAGLKLSCAGWIMVYALYSSLNPE